MSLMRVSAIKETLYATDQAGDLFDRPYANGIGKIGSFAEPDKGQEGLDTLAEHVKRTLTAAGPELDETDATPVVVLVHGFLFDPGKVIRPLPRENDNPHGRIYHFDQDTPAEEQRHHTTAWPLGLGFRKTDRIGTSGLAIAYGWQSQPGFARSLLEHFQNFYARAYDCAEMSAWPLLQLMLRLVDTEPLKTRLAAKRIDIFAHSLGSRLVVRMLAELAKAALNEPVNGVKPYKPAASSACRRALERIGRVVILGGSEYCVEAQLLYQRLERLGLLTVQASPTDGDGPGPTFYNLVCRENDVLDVLAENFGKRTFGNSQVIGHNGLGKRIGSPRWLDLSIDSERLQTWLAALPPGQTQDVAGDEPGAVWDHWYYYTYPGNMDFYRSILRQRGLWNLGRLRNGDVPDFPERRPIPEGVSTTIFGN